MFTFNPAFTSTQKTMFFKWMLKVLWSVGHTMQLSQSLPTWSSKRLGVHTNWVASADFFMTTERLIAHLTTALHEGLQTTCFVKPPEANGRHPTGRATIESDSDAKCSSLKSVLFFQFTNLKFTLLGFLVLFQLLFSTKLLVHCAHQQLHNFVSQLLVADQCGLTFKSC